MARYSIGDAVQSVSESEVGIIVLIYPEKPGKQLYDVVFESGQRKSVLEAHIIAIEKFGFDFIIYEKVDSMY